MILRFKLALASIVLCALVPAPGRATTREIAELQSSRLAFNQSVLNQLTFDTYRDSYDELQARPYNLLFSNIGRHTNLSPWEGDTGAYRHYLNALIGNNGAANVDNDADAIQGSMIRRETAALAWGAAAAFLSGTNGSTSSNPGSSFSDADDLKSFDLRGAVGLQLSERRVLGLGIRWYQAMTEVADAGFEPGVGGSRDSEEFDQSVIAIDAGLRHFSSARTSWDGRVLVALGDSTQYASSENFDDTGVLTDRFVSQNYEISRTELGLETGYNRLRRGGLGELQVRLGLHRVEQSLDRRDLSYSDSGGSVTPDVTLIGQDPITSIDARLTAQFVFPAGETEMFTGTDLTWRQISGSTRIDETGTIVNEQIDDTATRLGVTVGLRQPLMRDKLRFVVSGRADLFDEERTTAFDSSATSEETSLSTAQYAIGLEGVLANVTLDLAWLTGEEAAVVPVTLGLPAGSRRTVDLDRLVFSAAVSW